MNVLCVTPTLPVPTSGGRTRVFNLIKQLAREHKVFVLSFIQPSEEGMVSELTPHCERVELIRFDGFRPMGTWQNRIRGWYRILFHRRPRYVRTFPIDRMRLPLRALLTEHDLDVALFEFLQTASLSVEVGALPGILVEHNVESHIARQQYHEAKNPIHKARDWLTWQKLLRYERQWVRRFPTCVAVSEADAMRLRQMAPNTDVHVVPNGVDVQHFTPREVKRARETLLFFGTLSYGPNLDAVLWFCNQMWPRIRKARPEVKLEVVGLDPPSQVQQLENLPGVQITGFVPDIRPKLWSATATVVPLRLGGGTRLKILEALAAGCPVVSTSVGAEGLSLVDGEHLLLANTPEAFALRVVELLASPDLRENLVDSGRRIARREYDWAMIARRLQSVLHRAAGMQHNGGTR